jgi:HSP20 family protein
MPRQDPLREMIERMNEMVQEVGGERLQPGTDLPVDIEETDETVIVRADLPGVSKDNIQLKLQDNSLHIAAETEKELHEEGKDYVRKERSRKQYSRQVRLPVAVDESTASASYEDGVLTVEIDRLETESGTDIDIE